MGKSEKMELLLMATVVLNFLAAYLARSGWMGLPLIGTIVCYLVEVFDE